MVTIHNLEVRLDVEGEGDEAVFSRLFDKYIRKWHRLAEEVSASATPSRRKPLSRGSAEEENGRDWPAPFNLPDRA